jgi:hypothetical protein
VHPLDRALLDGLWNQMKAANVCEKGLLLTKLNADETPARPAVPKEFGDLSQGGLTVELLVKLERLTPGQTLFSTQEKNGQGVRILTAEIADQPTLEIELCDGARVVSWHTDPGALQAGKLNHVVFICDFSAAVISVVAEGVFLDGGSVRQYGWGRIPDGLGEVKGGFQALVAPGVKLLRLYNRPLRTSEAVANFRASLLQHKVSQ